MSEKLNFKKQNNFFNKDPQLKDYTEIIYLLKYFKRAANEKRLFFVIQ